MLKDPEAVKVRDWRHKLQKSFLSNKSIPKEEVTSTPNGSWLVQQSFDLSYLPGYACIGQLVEYRGEVRSD